MSKKGLNLLVYAYATSMFSSGILTPIYAFFIQKIGGGILETSCAISLFSIISGIAALLIYRTKWSHKYQQECLCIGWFLWLISIFMYCYITTLAMLFLSQVLNGLGNALLASAYDAEYSKQTIHDLAGGWSIWEGVTAIVTGLAAASGGFIATRYGFSVLMVCMTGMAVISFSLILLYVYREKAKVKNSNKLRG